MVDPLIPAPTTPPPQPGHPRPLGRMTIVEKVYHQAGPESAVETDNRPGFTRLVYSDEQPYLRRLKAGAEWVSIDTGWLTDVMMLRIANDEGRGLQSVENVKHLVIEISLRGDGVVDLILPPGSPHGEWVRFEPVHLNNIRLRCPSGEARYTVTAYPR